MNETLLTTILYVIIICFLGYLIFNYFKKERVQEGMRTLPRPIINAELQNPLNYKPAPPYLGEPLNQMIDRMIGQYFDSRGIAYYDTIDIYQTNCAGRGLVDVTPPQGEGYQDKLQLYELQKSKLTDIGYYILNIVIPNIQTTNNRDPEQKWPPITWTNKPHFRIKKSIKPTYQVFKGAAYSPSPSSSSDSTNGSSSSSDGSDGSTSNGDSTDSSSSTTDTTGTAPAPSDGSSGDCGDMNAYNKCGIACPTSCLDNVAAAQAEIDRLNEELQQQEQEENASGSISASQLNLSWLNFLSYQWVSQSSTEGSTTTGTSYLNNDNTLTIGDSTFRGFPTTSMSSCPLPPPSPSLTYNTNRENTDGSFNYATDDNGTQALSQKIANFIDRYFISDEDDINYNRPTDYALQEFDKYFKDKPPMDENHKNKLRDVVYYVMQVIIPGLPDGTKPYDENDSNNTCGDNTGIAFVEWIPLRWLSLSEPREDKYLYYQI